MTTRYDGDMKNSLSSCRNDVLTKSSYIAGQEEETAVRSATLILTDADGDAVCAYSTSESFQLELKAGMEYTADVFVNMGDLRGEIRNHEEVPAYKHELTEAGIISGGLPMFGTKTFTVSSSTSTISTVVERLVARYELRFSSSGITSGSMRVKSVQMKNVPRFVGSGIFRASSQSEITAQGDYASPGDIALINGGGGACFYMPENRQGNETGILIPSDKVPSYSFHTVNPDLCSYLEVTCGYTMQGVSQSEDIIYRLYLGANSTDDFNVTRNTRYRITLQPSDVNPDHSWWKCEPQFSFDYLLQISPGKAEISVGESICLSATLGKHLHGSLMESTDVSSSAAWNVLSGQDKLINAGNGLFTALDEGMAYVSASSGSIDSEPALIRINSGQKVITMNILAHGGSFGMKYWVRATNGILNAACYATAGTESVTRSFTVRKTDESDIFTVTPQTLTAPSGMDYHTYETVIDGVPHIGSGSFSIDWSNPGNETHDIAVTPVYPQTRNFTLTSIPPNSSNGLSASISYKNNIYDEEAEVEAGRNVHFIQAVATEGVPVSETETLQVFGNTIRVQGFRIFGSTAENVEVYCNGIRVFSGKLRTLNDTIGFETPEFEINSQNVIIQVYLR